MLRKLLEKDIDKMLEWMKDDEVSRYFRTSFSAFTREDVERFIADSFTENNRHFAIVNDKDEYQGTVSLKNISKEDHNAEYAIVLRRQSQGMGYARLATKEIMHYAFDELNLQRVYLNVLKENEHARRFYEKVGFVQEGIFRQHWCVRGQFYDLYWFAINKSEFKRL